MSRLQQHRQHENNQKIIKMILVSVVLLFIFFFIGLQSIINATVFINNLIRGNSASQTEETEKDSFYGILNVDEPDVATSSASIIITGDATEFKQVEFYINNIKADSTSIKTNGTFTKEIGKLRVGENKVYVIAKTADSKEKKQSESFNVTYVNEPPKLEIDSPKDQDKTSKNEIQVKGKTDKDVTVHVNNLPTIVDFEGNFSAMVRLKEGENKLEFTATDVAGNVEKKEIKVIYQKEE